MSIDALHNLDESNLFFETKLSFLIARCYLRFRGASEIFDTVPRVRFCESQCPTPASGHPNCPPSVLGSSAATVNGNRQREKERYQKIFSDDIFICIMTLCTQP